MNGNRSAKTGALLEGTDADLRAEIAETAERTGASTDDFLTGMYETEVQDS